MNFLQRILLIAIACVLTTSGVLNAAEQQTWTVSGRVVDPHDKPLAGAKLYAAIGGSSGDARAVTGSSGEFSFQLKRSEFGLNESGIPGKFTKLVAVAEGYGCDAHAACSFEPTGRLMAGIAVAPFPIGDRWDRTLKLAADDIPIVGRIVDSEGRPVANANVRVTELWIPNAIDLSPWEAAVKSGEDYDIVMLNMMDRGRKLAGRSLDGILPSTRTASDGTFRLSGGIGNERIVGLAISGRNIVSRKVFGRTRPGPTYNVPHILEVPRGGTFRFFGSTLDYVVESSRPITGTVRDLTTGEPIAGVPIRFEAGPHDQTLWMEFDQIAVRTVSNQNGSFTLTGAPAGTDHTLLAVSSDKLYLPAAKSVATTKGTGSPSVDFRLTKGVRITGRITDKKTGDPVAAQLTWFLPTDNPLSGKVKDLRGATIVPWQKPYLTNGNGEYQNVGLPGRGFLAVLVADWRSYTMGNGVSDLRQKHVEYLKKRNEPNLCFLIRTSPSYCAPDSYHFVTEIDIPSEVDTYQFDIALSPETQLHGKLLDPAGKPLSGATYSGLYEGDGPFFKTTSERFTINAYHPDEPRQVFFVNKQSRLAGDILIEGEQPDPITVKLKPWGTITGRLVDSNGEALAKALIRGYAPGHGNRPGRGEFLRRHYFADEEGQFKIEGLVPGLHYELEVIDNGKIIATSEMDIVVKSDENYDLGDVITGTAK